MTIFSIRNSHVMITLKSSSSAVIVQLLDVSIRRGVTYTTLSIQRYEICRALQGFRLCKNSALMTIFSNQSSHVLATFQDLCRTKVPPQTSPQTFQSRYDKWRTTFIFIFSSRQGRADFLIFFFHSKIKTFRFLQTLRFKNRNSWQVWKYRPTLIIPLLKNT